VTPVNDQLQSAIENKRLIKVRYHGSLRVAEPHDYGVHNGVEKLLVYQLRGTVRSPQRSTTGWRLLEVSKIEACVVLDETFPGSRGQQHRNHLKWEIVYARVA
jgi:hypothetical protein